MSEGDEVSRSIPSQPGDARDAFDDVIDEHNQLYQHTPGPWRIYEDGMIGSASVRRFPEMTVIKPGTVKGETIGVAMANAKLIAAAPELLAACKAAMAFGSQGDTHDGLSVSEILRAAVAKAEGKTS
jgi:hypothetical protein